MWSRAKAGKLSTAPAASHSTVISRTARTSLTMPFRFSTFSASRTRERPFRLMRRPVTSASPMPMDATPRPPIWISTAMTSWPNRLKVSPVSTTTSPVTQTALVEVKSAFSGVICTPGCTENGSMSSAAPQRISTAKPMAMIRAGGCVFKNCWTALRICCMVFFPPADCIGCIIAHFPLRDQIYFFFAPQGGAGGAQIALAVLR